MFHNTVVLSPSSYCLLWDVRVHIKTQSLENANTNPKVFPSSIQKPALSLRVRRHVTGDHKLESVSLYLDAVALSLRHSFATAATAFCLFSLFNFHCQMSNVSSDESAIKVKACPTLPHTRSVQAWYLKKPTVRPLGVIVQVFVCVFMCVYTIPVFSELHVKDYI